MNKTEKVIHPIPPLYNERSEILVLGSFPSVKSRETAFFYGHPRNRFWWMIAEIFEEEKPKTVEEKKKLILGHHLALWDVIAECEISGSSDSSIRNVKANNLGMILEHAPIRKILLNGKTAGNLFQKYIGDKTAIEYMVLPSTSPANAAWSPDRLKEAWKEAFIDIRERLREEYIGK